MRKLMIAKYGVSYQVVDDAGGDGGLDGYERTSHQLHAIYCPEKPKSARYRRKFRGDLRKAAELREAGYRIAVFVFITPAPMRKPDQRVLREEAQAAGFEDGINIASEHLETMLAEHPELHDHFPELVFPDVSAKLDRILEVLAPGQNARGGEKDQGSEAPEPYHTGLFVGVESPELLDLQDRFHSGDDSAGVALEQFRLETDSTVVQLAASSLELEFHFRAGAFQNAARRARERRRSTDGIWRGYTSIGIFRVDERERQTSLLGGFLAI